VVQTIEFHIEQGKFPYTIAIKVGEEIVKKVHNIIPETNIPSTDCDYHHTRI
jgi:hypothetical protein